MIEYLEGNRLELLRSGVEYFPALERAIGGAKDDIYLETYIYEDDAAGRRITEALCDAARRGVRVHVIVDGFGAKDLSPKIRAALAAAGAMLLVFRPEIYRFPFRRHRLRRMHRKLTVVDDKLAFVGGINIIDDLHTPGQIPPRYDFAVQVEGPLLAPMREEAKKLWARIFSINHHRRWRFPHSVAADGAPKGQQRAALVVRDNLRHRADIEDAYLGLIGAARSEIVLANAYFFPGIRFRRALISAAQRGVRVVLLLQGRVEYLLLHYASRALYGTLLHAGVEIHEYHKSFMHAKVAVIDARWATVGSSNIDPFSLMLAREANVFVDDRRFAQELRLSLQRAMEEGGRLVAKTSWFHQPLWQRLPIWAAYSLVRFLMGMVGYGGQHY